jgi:small-conductance mechanosensitive channel
MREIAAHLDTLVYFGNSLLSYCISLAGFVGGYIILSILRRYVLHRLTAWAEKTETRFDDVIVISVRRDVMPLLRFYLVYGSIVWLNLNPSIYTFMKGVILVITVFYVIRFSLEALVFWLDNYWAGEGESDAAKKKVGSAVATILKILLWAIGILIVLDNMGVEISAIMAGLGVGGIAVAFAAQAILGDIFSYFSIFFDRPFELGDFIVAGECLGRVEQIGVKTTKLRSLSGELLIISNADLTKSRVKNYKLMEERRVLFRIGVTYDTPYETLKEIPEIMRGIIEAQPLARFERCTFMEYGDFSLIFETVYFVKSNDYQIYADTQQAINLELKRVFDEKKITFAFPTQTIYMAK